MNVAVDLPLKDSRRIVQIVNMNDATETSANPPQQPTFLDGMRLGPYMWAATGLGVGFIPWAPGTFGTLWGLPLAWGINRIPSVLVQVALILVICLIGIPICHRGATALGRKDPGSVVWDEIAAIPITFFLVPASRMSSFWVLLAGFLLFRFFDISKIPPAKQVERCPSGIGIMADDWVAGVYACVCLHVLLWMNVLP